MRNSNPYIIFLSVFLIHFPSSAQQILQKSFGGIVSDVPYSMIQTHDNGFLIGGTSKSFSTLNAGLLLKLDTASMLQWSKIYNNTSLQYNTQIEKVIQLANTNYFCLGVSYNLPDVYNWVMITDTLGNVLLHKKLSLGSGDWFAFADVIENPNGTITLCGLNDYGNTIVGHTESKLLLVTLNASLVPVWSREYHYHYKDKFVRIRHTPDHQFILQAHTMDSLPPGREDILLFKIDTVGDISWAIRCGDSVPSNISNSWLRQGDIVVQPDGSIYNTFTSNWFNLFGFKYLILQKLDSLGNEMLSAHYYYSGDGEWKIVKQDTNNIIVYTGLYFIKVDSMLNVLWRKRIRPLSVLNVIGVSTLIHKNQTGFAFSTGKYDGGITGYVYFSLIDSIGNIGCDTLNIATPVLQQVQIPSVNILPDVVASTIIIYDSLLSYNSQTVNLPDSVYCNTATFFNEVRSESTARYLPNPATDYLYIDVSFDFKVDHVTVLDLFGNRMPVFLSDKNRLDVKPLKPGIYITVISTNTNSVVFKFIKM